MRQEKSGKVLQRSDSSCFINASPDGSGFFCKMSQLSTKRHSSGLTDVSEEMLSDGKRLLSCQGRPVVHSMARDRGRLTSAPQVAMRGHQKSC